MNPTQGVLEERVAALEGGTTALATASGHAAQLLIFHTIMSPGDNFRCRQKVYGGSINQFGHAFKSFDWQVRWADMSDPANIEPLIDARTKAIFIECLAIRAAPLSTSKRFPPSPRSTAAAHRRQHDGFALSRPSDRPWRRHRRSFVD